MKAIARLRKINSRPRLLKTLRHNLRDEPHADHPHVQPDGIAEILRGPRKSREVMEDFERRLPAIRRRDAVIAIEIMLSASPEYFRPQNPQKPGEYEKCRLDAWRERSMRFLDAEYDRNLLSVALHLDESTPHLQALAIPLVEGRLCAKEVVGGPRGLRAWQSRYADAMKDIEIRRGALGSKTKHEDLRKYYEKVNASTQAHGIPQVETIIQPTRAHIDVGAKLQEQALEIRELREHLAASKWEVRGLKRELKLAKQTLRKKPPTSDFRM